MNKGLVQCSCRRGFKGVNCTGIILETAEFETGLNNSILFLNANVVLSPAFICVFAFKLGHRSYTVIFATKLFGRALF